MTGLRLAWFEAWRERRRALLATSAFGLVLTVALAVAGLADGLHRGSTGIVRALDADLVITDESARGQILRSRVPAPQLNALLGVEGVSDTGVVSLLPTTAEVGDDRVRVTAVGFTSRSPAEPVDLIDGRVPVTGEPRIAAVDARLRGVAVGDVLRLGGAREVEVTGLIDDGSFLQQPTVWLPHEEWARLRSAVLPEGSYAERLIGAGMVRLAPDADGTAVAREIAEALDHEVEVLTREEAIAEVPGVTAQTLTLGTITGVAVGVAAVVAALLGAFAVLERRAVFAALRAFGAPGRTILTAVLGRVAVTSLAGSVGAWALVWVLTLAAPPTVPIDVRPTVLLSVVSIASVGALAGAALAAAVLLRRITPAAAFEEAPR